VVPDGAPLGSVASPRITFLIRMGVVLNAAAMASTDKPDRRIAAMRS
jgi:hypothetical protein